MNTFSGVTEGDSVALAPPLPGDIAVIEMHGETLMVQSGSYLASSEGIEVETKWSGAKTFFGSEGLIMLRIHGTGTLIVSSYGAIPPDGAGGRREVCGRHWSPGHVRRAPKIRPEEGGRLEKAPYSAAKGWWSS